MNQYDTDKIKNGILDDYVKIFSVLKDKKISLLEIGVLKGGSIRFWSDFFTHENAQIIGIDISPPGIEFPENVVIYKCDQNNTKMLREIAAKHGPFDIIIDDGSHRAKETENCFTNLINYVTAGGYYIIEDWAAGYMDVRKYKGMIEVVIDKIKKWPKMQDKIRGYSIIMDPPKTYAIFYTAAETSK